MSTLQQLQAVESLESFAALLGYSARGLAFIVYRQTEASKYTEFRIRKRSGGERVISAPEPRLKRLQKRLAVLLAEVDREIRVLPPGRNLSHGFRKGYSIVTNAKEHVRRRHVLNVDIEDFFPSFNFGRVRGYLIKNKRLKLPPLVATLIAQIACYKNTLPQGSPCSPILTNIVGSLLDIELVRMAKRHGCHYSRYADDITISTNEQVFPVAVAMLRGAGQWVAGADLARAVERAGFRLNESKTRLSDQTGRQSVTGLTVNRRVNVPASYYRYARAMAHSLFATGAYVVPSGAMRPRDKSKIRRNRWQVWMRRWLPSYLYDAALPLVSILQRLCRRLKRAPKITTVDLAEVDAIVTQPASEVAIHRMQGILSYASFIRRLDEDPKLKPEEATGARKLYRKFLFFRHFHITKLPAIVTEGPTDVVYLKAAIRRLVGSYPKLASIGPDGKFRLKVRFVRHTRSVTEVLGLSGGTDPIKKIILEYEGMMDRFQAPGQLAPVIAVLDNDSGAKDLYGVLNNKLKLTLGVAVGMPATRITKNLYALSTPPKAGGMSAVEDCFQPTTLATKLGTKTFNYHSNKIDDSKEYGKSAFAEHVVLAQQATIDFSGFVPVLDQIVAAIDAYAAVLVATPISAAAPVVPAPVIVAP